MSVGVIGVGHLGRHFATRLVEAGYDVSVYDTDPAATARLAAVGATVTGSVAQLAACCDVVLTCLPSSQVIDQVVAGPGGVLGAARPGTTWIDTSTNDPNELRRLAGVAHEHAVTVLEAPVSGGVHRAATGEITVIVGGDEAVFERHRALLGVIGASVFHVGAFGQASTLKVITNMLAFIHLVAVGEALMLASRGGIDLAQAYAVIRASSGNSFVHETESQLILNGSYDVGFTIALALKDLGFAHTLGRDLGVPLELAGLVEQTFLRARAAYGDDAWSSMVVRLLEDACDTELRAPGFPATLDP